MRTEIYIENQQLDLYKDISAEFTYNIDDVKDFSSRNTNFSKTIVIPGNATNNKLFGHIFEFGNSNFYNPTADNVGYNFNAAKSAACVVYVDKIQIFKGIIRLLEIIIDNGSIEYECAVFGELGGFVSAIANGKIEDLDFSAYNHVWNVTNITNSWNQVDGSGYFYPLIDYGQVSVSKKDWQYKAFRPALFVREYIDKIITGAGYTWESSFFNTNLFKRLVIPNNQKDLSAYSTTAFKSDVLPKFDTTDYYAAAGSNIKLEYPSPSIAGSFTASLSNTRFTYTGASTISITVTATLNGSYEDSAETMYFVVRKNGTTDIATSPSVENLYDSFDFTFSGTGTFATNDYFEVIAIRQNNALDYRIFINSGNIELNTDVTQAVVLNRNELIQINKTIPRGVFQKDFFSSIVKMFNLYVTESTDKTKHLIISPYIDYYDFNDTIDWSLKIDRSKPFRLKPMSELNGRFFEYKYKQDADFYNENYFKKYNEGYGDFIEDTGYEFANERQTAEIIFAEIGRASCRERVCNDV